jgi:hypothetical protein
MAKNDNKGKKKIKLGSDTTPNDIPYTGSTMEDNSQQKETASSAESKTVQGKSIMTKYAGYDPATLRLTLGQKAAYRKAGYTDVDQVKTVLAPGIRMKLGTLEAVYDKNQEAVNPNLVNEQSDFQKASALFGTMPNRIPGVTMGAAVDLGTSTSAATNEKKGSSGGGKKSSPKITTGATTPNGPSSYFNQKELDDLVKWHQETADKNVKTQQTVQPTPGATSNPKISKQANAIVGNFDVEYQNALKWVQEKNPTMSKAEMEKWAREAAYIKSAPVEAELKYGKLSDEELYLQRGLNTGMGLWDVEVKRRGYNSTQDFYRKLFVKPANTTSKKITTTNSGPVTEKKQEPQKAQQIQEKPTFKF